MLPHVRENETVAGKYRIGRTLGEGGMGVVVAARHLELDQMVAIKFLRPEIAEEAASAERFRREARAAARIRSPHICRVLDVGTTEDGLPYLVMEYLEGCDLSDELAKRGRFPVPEALDYVLQACEGLSEAHACGIVHRDLKPGNLYLESRSDGSRSIKVLDFGVSKSLIESAGQLKLTKTASLVGSPLYMSPEQLDAAIDVDARVDIWALGTILYELIAGRTPFLADTIPQLVNAVMNGTHPSFQSLGIPAPLGLEAVVSRALSKRREDRYPSITEFAQALLPFAASYGAVSVSRATRLSMAHSGPLTPNSGMAPYSAGPVGSGSSPSNPGLRTEVSASRTFDVASNLPSGTPASWQRTSNNPHKANRRAVIIGLALVPILGALLLYVLFSGGNDSTPPVAPAPKAAATASLPPGPTAMAAAQPPAPSAGEASGSNPVVSTPVSPPVVAAVTASPVMGSRPAKPPAGKLPARPPVLRPGSTEPSVPRPETSPPSKGDPAGDSISDFGGRR
jgi:serine/threonine-protein kinase